MTSTVSDLPRVLIVEYHAFTHMTLTTMPDLSDTSVLDEANNVSLTAEARVQLARGYTDLAGQSVRDGER